MPEFADFIARIQSLADQDQLAASIADVLQSEPEFAASLRPFDCQKLVAALCAALTHPLNHPFQFRLQPSVRESLMLIPSQWNFSMRPQFENIGEFYAGLLKGS